ncbi:MAG: hypothetical protein M3498_02110, partial [Deinococcota bacterium]|nr:hypothetical protein [Deinococcota bacterium]
MKQANAKRLWLSVVLLAAFGWFGFAVAAPEIVGEVEAGLNEDQEMVVRFQTDGPAMSEVSYGAEGDLSQTTEEVTALEGEHEHVLTEIAPGTSYSYRIRVWDWSGSEYSSDEMTLTTPALAPPGGLRAMTGDETVTLSWDLAFGAREYLVQRAETPGGPYDTVATVEGNSYQDVGVSNDQEYYYLVSAVGPAEDASEASAELAVRVEPSLASDSFEDGLDETVWRVYRTNPDAEIAVAGGQLRMENFSTGGWENNQGGVMLNQALDLTGVTTVVEIEYAEAGWTQQNPGFWADGSIDGDDTWNHPGFRLTVGGSGFNSEVTPAADASFEPGLSGEATPPYTLEWVLTHEEGTTLDTQALIGGELVSEGRIDLGSLDPSELYLYLYVSNDTAEGSAAFERVAVRQEPVQAADQTLTAATEETTEEATASATTDEPAQETATEEAGGQEAAPQTAEGATELTQATEDAEEAAEDTEEADAAATTEGETATVPVDEGLDLPVAVQLYSLRDFGSFEEQLALVAETGYLAVELVGNHGLSADEMNELLERYNLRAISAHYGLDDLRNNLDEIVAFSQAIDNQNIVMPWLPQYMRPDSVEGWQELDASSMRSACACARSACSSPTTTTIS